MSLIESTLARLQAEIADDPSNAEEQFSAVQVGIVFMKLHEAAKRLNRTRIYAEAMMKSDNELVREYGAQILAFLADDEVQS